VGAFLYGGKEVANMYASGKSADTQALLQVTLFVILIMLLLFVVWLIIILLFLSFVGLIADDNYIISCANATITIWNKNTGQAGRHIRTAAGLMTLVAIHGDFIISYFYIIGKFSVWNIHSGECSSWNADVESPLVHQFMYGDNIIGVTKSKVVMWNQAGHKKVLTKGEVMMVFSLLLYYIL